ncbi:1895_t:CDS:2, partial [Cetraspora pellucida]
EKFGNPDEDNNLSKELLYVKYLVKEYLEEVNRFWFKEIQNSKNLTTDQRVNLNTQHDEQLKTLSNEQYDSIDKEIPNIDDTNPLNNKKTIDNKIRKLKNKNLSSNRDVNTLQQQR